jgi:hypothetical protein
MDESPSAVCDVAGQQVHNVFLPSSPSPASGRLVLVPDDQLHEVDLSVRQGLRLLMTTGAGYREDDLELPPGLDEHISDAAASRDSLATESRESHSGSATEESEDEPVATDAAEPNADDEDSPADSDARGSSEDS